MASTTTIKISSRSKPVRGLPSTLEVTDKTTFQDVKVAVAKGGRWDPERMGLFGAESAKIFKDRKQLVLLHPEILSTKEIKVKDLGKQMAWTTVFILEYLGPLLIHPFFLLIRPYIYKTAPPLTTSQILAFTMIMLHFLKREYETLFVHKFSLATMPWSNIWWNCGWYWLGAGLVLAPEIYSDFSSTSQESSTITILNIVGVIIYLYGEISNYITHLNLASLRTRGGTERQIPRGYGFNLVTCPNYMFELVSWIGVLLVTRTAGAVLFFGLALWKMNQWAIKKEKAYRNEFPDTYKRKKYYIVPSPGAVIKAITGSGQKYRIGA